MRKGLLIFFGILFVLLVWYGEKRSFFCVGNEKCVTVWKTYGNVCYIVPGKYFGLIKPSDNYVLTTNINDVTIYWDEGLNKSIIVRCEKEFKIINKSKDKITIHSFYDDADYYSNLLYNINPRHFSDVKNNVNFISLYIKENYAIDKKGKKL